MRRFSCLILLLATMMIAAPARSADVVGIADQNPGMFTSPWFQKLDIHVSRLIVSYDAVLNNTFEVADIDRWLAYAGALGIEPLISFNAPRGCYVDGKYRMRLWRCRLPSATRFKHAFIAFRQRYPTLNVYSPWNEANHHGQPTYDNPRRAAQFYNVVRKNCIGCRIVAADVLDQRGMTEWLKTFRRYADGKPRLWGLHNYQDVNNHTTFGTRDLLRAVKGEIWLTETGGIVNFPHRPFNPARAARATKFMFKLAGSSPRVKRLYIYQWFGQKRTARFDAGLVTDEGNPRPAYYVVYRHLAKPGGNPEPTPAPPPPPPPEPTPTPSPTPTPTPTPDPCIVPLICP